MSEHKSIPTPEPFKKLPIRRMTSKSDPLQYCITSERDSIPTPEPFKKSSTERIRTKSDPFELSEHDSVRTPELLKKLRTQRITTKSDPFKLCIIYFAMSFAVWIFVALGNRLYLYNTGNYFNIGSDRMIFEFSGRSYNILNLGVILPLLGLGGTCRKMRSVLISYLILSTAYALVLIIDSVYETRLEDQSVGTYKMLESHFVDSLTLVVLIFNTIHWFIAFCLTILLLKQIKRESIKKDMNFHYFSQNQITLADGTYFLPGFSMNQSTRTQRPQPIFTKMRTEPKKKSVENTNNESEFVV